MTISKCGQDRRESVLYKVFIVFWGVAVGVDIYKNELSSNQLLFMFPSTYIILLNMYKGKC